MLACASSSPAHVLPRSSLGEWVGALTRCPVKLLCVWLPFWVLGVPMVPVAVLLVFLAVLLGCFTWLGPACGVAGYVST